MADIRNVIVRKYGSAFQSDASQLMQFYNSLSCKILPAAVSVKSVALPFSSRRDVVNILMY